MQLKFKVFFAFLFVSILSKAQTPDSSGFYYHPVLVGGKYGYIDNTGHLVIKPQFDECGLFNEGYAPAKVNGKYGFINSTGEWFVKPQFDTAREFSDGFAAVASKGESEYPTLNWDWISTKGYLLSPKLPALSSATDFNSGRAICMEDGFLSFHFIKKNGDTAFAPKKFYLDEIKMTNYSDGILRVHIGNYLSAYVDTSGNFILDSAYINCGDFHEGLAFYQSNNGKYGFINRRGEIVVAPQYDTAGNFNNGAALVKIKTSLDQVNMKLTGGLVGYIGTDGKYIAPAIYEYGSEFSSGLALVKLKGKYGFINSEGFPVIDFIYEDAKPFVRGLAYVKLDNHWIYINQKGRKVW